jgi:hypothetical protein
MAPYNRQYFNPNTNAYREYYLNQAGGSISRFRGGDQYGYGLASILGAIVRKIIPIARGVLKPAVAIAKPHLKAAVKDIAVAAVKKVVRATTGRKKKKQTRAKQTGGRRRSKPKKKKPARRRRKKKTSNIF